MRCTSTRAPHGAWLSRWATSASSSCSGSAPGTIRIEIFALACGIRTFDDPAMLVMSSPIALIDGFAHSREPMVPVPVRSTPSSRSALERKSSGAEALAVPRARRDARDRDVARVVVQGREQARERHHRVGRRPAEDPGVQRVLERADGHDAGDVAAQRGGQGGLADAQVAHVADEEHVAVEQLRVGQHEGLEVALRLLHPLEDQLDRARRLPVEDPQGAEVGHQPALVVGGPAAVDPSVVLAGRRPGIAGPALLGRRRLHVVVRVQHDHR